MIETREMPMCLLHPKRRAVEVGPYTGGHEFLCQECADRYLKPDRERVPVPLPAPPRDPELTSYLHGNPGEWKGWFSAVQPLFALVACGVAIICGVYLFLASLRWLLDLGGV